MRATPALLRSFPRLAVSAAVSGMVSLALAQQLPAASSVIDEFEDGAISVLTFAAPASGSVAASVAGGVRRIVVSINTPGFGAAIAEVDPTAAYIQGMLDVANNIPGSKVVLTYDGGGVGLGNTGPGAGDYTMFNEFQVTFDFLNLAGGSLLTGITVVDTDSDSSTYAVILNSDIGTPLVGSPTTYSFPFSSFDPSIDFGRLDRILVSFDTGMDRDVDFRLESITAVPEPAAGALLGCAAAVIALRRRRKAP